jgi:[lysine-biosynthesis-protein LysW]---L-2-aminoadipate ligase
MTTSTTVTLLAPRMRVEERLLIAAFADRDAEAHLFDATTLALPLTGAQLSLPSVILDRDVATADRATLAALLAANGSIVVNRTATTRLLADRLALMRHLIIAGIPTPRTVVAFGEQPAVEALEQVGYPALLQSLQVDPRMPDAVVTDLDAGEAAIEHRSMLGRETALLVQQYVLGDVARVVVAGAEVVGIETICSEGGKVEYLPYERDTAALTKLVEKVIGRLGSGVYAVEVVESAAGPIVVGAGNLVDFRTLHDAGIDIAGKIAEFILSQPREAQDGG